MSDSIPPAQGASPSEVGVYNRLGQAETRIETTRTEVVALTRQMSSAVEEMGKQFALFRQEFLEFQRSSRPQYVGIISIFVAAIALVGTLTASFMNARISPLEHDLISSERQTALKATETDRRILEEVDRNEKRHIGQQAQMQAMLEKLLETRERIARNDARIEELQRRVFHDPLPAAPQVKLSGAGNAP